MLGRALLLRARAWERALLAGARSCLAVLGLAGQFLTYQPERRAGPASGGADISDRRVQGVLPEVVGLPPGDLVEQVWLGSAVQRRRCQDRELKLLVLPSAEGAVGQELLLHPF